MDAAEAEAPSSLAFASAAEEATPAGPVVVGQGGGFDLAPVPAAAGFVPFVA